MTAGIAFLSWLNGHIGKPRGWERVVCALAPPEKCKALGEPCVLRDGSLFVVQPGLQLGWHVLLFGAYEREVREIMRAVVPRGGTVIDVGANVGWHSLLMARLVGADGRVLAVEANASIRRRLALNIALNRLANVDLVPCALSSREQMLKFTVRTAEQPDSASGHVLADDAGGEAAAIEARPLDAIVREKACARVDFLKIDVEGFEWPVLQGAEETVSRFRPHIVFEFDKAYWPRGGGDPASLSAFFDTHRYRLFTIGRDCCTAIAGDWPDCANIYAVPAGE